tara:strand:+ start:224 stop:523 length:300 start_codon:yes stop_codon:yes gene_type:complete
LHPESTLQGRRKEKVKSEDVVRLSAEPFLSYKISTSHWWSGNDNSVDRPLRASRDKLQMEEHAKMHSMLLSEKVCDKSLVAKDHSYVNKLQFFLFFFIF